MHVVRDFLDRIEIENWPCRTLFDLGAPQACCFKLRDRSFHHHRVVMPEEPRGDVPTDGQPNSVLADAFRPLRIALDYRGRFRRRTQSKRLINVELHQRAAISAFQRAPCIEVRADTEMARHLPAARVPDRPCPHFTRIVQRTDNSTHRLIAELNEPVEHNPIVNHLVSIPRSITGYRVG